MVFFRSAIGGLIEIEASYVRLVKRVGGRWQARGIPIEDGQLYEVLRRECPAFFGSIRRIGIIMGIDAGAKMLPFATSIPPAEIDSHLALKREEYFGQREELTFALRPCGTDAGGAREMLVSWVRRSILEKLTLMLEPLGFVVVRVVTAIETLIGAYHRQVCANTAGTSCLLSLGYSGVHMVIVRDGVVAGVRTAITGSLREIEARLLRSLKIERDELIQYLVGAAFDPDPSVLEMIRQSQQELISRVTPLMASLRGKNGDTKNMRIFLACPYLEISGICDLLEQTFLVDVVPLTGMTADESKADPALAQSGWLLGAEHDQAVNLVRDVAPFWQFAVAPRVAWVFVVFFLLAPLAFVRLELAAVRGRITELQYRTGAATDLLRRIQANDALKGQLLNTSALIANELNQRLCCTDLVRQATRAAAGHLRFESIEVQGTARRFLLSGVAVDTETALRFWDALKAAPLFAQAKIDFPVRSNPGPARFTIQADLGRR